MADQNYVSKDNLTEYNNKLKTKVNEKFVPKADIVNDLTATTAGKVLDATQGKVLNTRIDNITSMGRFLSTWDCALGKPADNPPGELPYTYKSGDYYIVGNITASTPGINYKPKGSQYTGVSSQDMEPEGGSVHVNDIYRYTSSGWVLQSQEEKTVAFSTIAGNATDNTNLKAELDKKLDIKTDASRVQSVYVSNQNGTQALEPVASAETDGGIAKMQLARKYVDDKIYNGLDKTAEGFVLDARQGKALKDSVDGKISLLGVAPGTTSEPYHFPFYYDIKPQKDGIFIGMDTITLDNNKTIQRASFTVPQAIVTPSTEYPDGMAGLYTKALADANKTSVTQVVSSGTEIAKIGVGSETPVSIFAPATEAPWISRYEMNMGSSTGGKWTSTISIPGGKTAGGVFEEIVKGKAEISVEFNDDEGIGQRKANFYSFGVDSGNDDNPPKVISRCLVSKDVSQGEKGSYTIYKEYELVVALSSDSTTITCTMTKSPERLKTVNGESIYIDPSNPSTTSIQIIDDSQRTDSLTWSSDKIDDCKTNIMEFTAEATGQTTFKLTISDDEYSRLCEGRNTIAVNIEVSGVVAYKAIGSAFVYTTVEGETHVEIVTICATTKLGAIRSAGVTITGAGIFDGYIVDTPSWGSITGTLAEQTDISEALAGKVEKNSDIESATKCKITYDNKGLVTAGADLEASDIPELATSKITGLDEALAAKQNAALVTAFQTTPDDTHYPSEKLVHDFVKEYAADFKGSVATKADLETITGMNINDWAIVLADESQSGKTTRYGWNGTAWNLQWAINNMSFTTAQMDAINSTITAAKVSTYDGYATTLANKVDKVDGYGLSKNDFSDTLLTKLNGIADGATKTVVDTDLDRSSTNAIANKAVTDELNAKQDKSTLETDVAAKGFTKNGVTGVKMNGSTVTVTSGVADLGTVITAHQSLAAYSTTEQMNTAISTATSGKLDKPTAAIGDGKQICYYNGTGLVGGITITSGTGDPSGTPTGGVGSIYIKYTA